jgi:hypothetical protein
VQQGERRLYGAQHTGQSAFAALAHNTDKMRVLVSHQSFDHVVSSVYWCGRRSPPALHMRAAHVDTGKNVYLIKVQQRRELGTRERGGIFSIQMRALLMNGKMQVP